MLNKNLIFIFLSLLLGLLISLYYKKNIFLFIPISIILYIIFYYLADIKNNEHFDDYLEEEHRICEEEIIKEQIKEPVKNLISEDIKSQIGYGPLNINISYNSQNSVNELTNTQSTPSSTSSTPSTTPPPPPIPKQNQQYNNSFWTNYPNVNIPSYEPLYSYKYKNNAVCPLMINTPWTEYKSGDSEPEPYNM
jgi:hypothetical protein